MGAHPIRALGVDPGLTRTGWALVHAERRRYRLLDSGILATSPDVELPLRLADAFRRFSSILELAEPDLLVMEDIFTAPRFPAAALKMAHLRGVLCLAGAQAGLEVISLTATTVKQRLTGNGHASKEQVQRMVLELCEVPGRRTAPDDEADRRRSKIPSDLTDAVALAIAGLHQLATRPLGNALSPLLATGGTRRRSRAAAFARLVDEALSQGEAR